MSKTKDAAFLAGLGILVFVIGSRNQADSPRVDLFTSIDVNGATREYRVATTQTPHDRITLVFAFHGSTVDSMFLMPLYSNLDTLANDKTVVIYPNAISQKWDLLGDTDIRFFDALVDKYRSVHQIDNIFLVGMSRGGKFANIINSQRPIDGIALHSSSLGDLTSVNAPKKCPVIIIHGINDALIPLADAQAMRDVYLAEGHPVKYYEIPNLGHFWADGAEQTIAEQLHLKPGAIMIT